MFYRRQVYLGEILVFKYKYFGILMIMYMITNMKILNSKYFSEHSLVYDSYNTSGRGHLCF